MAKTEAMIAIAIPAAIKPYSIAYKETLVAAHVDWVEGHGGRLDVPTAEQIEKLRSLGYIR